MKSLHPRPCPFNKKSHLAVLLQGLQLLLRILELRAQLCIQHLRLVRAVGGSEKRAFSTRRNMKRSCWPSTPWIPERRSHTSDTVPCFAPGVRWLDLVLTFFLLSRGCLDLLEQNLLCFVLLLLVQECCLPRGWANLSETDAGRAAPVPKPSQLSPRPRRPPRLQALTMTSRVQARQHGSCKALRSSRSLSAMPCCSSRRPRSRSRSFLSSATSVSLTVVEVPRS